MINGKFLQAKFVSKPIKSGKKKKLEINKPSKNYFQISQ